MENIKWRVIKLEETASTNTYIDELDVQEGEPEGCVVVTHTQSAGRGQRGNSWEAAPGKNLTFSYLLRPKGIVPSEQFILSQAVAMAVVDVLLRYTDDITVKWPNDIYYRDSKIAGILIEHNLAGMSIDRTIVGIGLNINQSEFHSDAPNPISLTQITGQQYNLDSILAEIFEATSYRYAMCYTDRERLQSDYASVLYRREGYYLYRDTNGVFEARIEKVMPDGHFVLYDREGNRRIYAFKEVAFVI